MNVKEIIAREKPCAVEISPMNLMKDLWHRVWILILAALIAGGIGFTVGSKPIEPVYESAYTVYLGYNEEPVEYKGDKIVNIPEKKNAHDLLSTYQLIVTNSHVLRRAAVAAGFEASDSALKNMVSVTLSSEETNIAKVVVHSGDKNQATAFISGLAAISADELSERMESSFVSMVEDISVPENISASPNPVKSAVLYAFLALVLAAAVIIIKEIADDKVKSARELELRSGILVLASVPAAGKLKRAKR